MCVCVYVCACVCVCVCVYLANLYEKLFLQYTVQLSDLHVILWHIKVVLQLLVQRVYILHCFQGEIRNVTHVIVINSTLLYRQTVMPAVFTFGIVFLQHEVPIQFTECSSLCVNVHSNC